MYQWFIMIFRSFIDAYSPCKQLALFIKKWLSLFDLPGRHGFTSYALVWLVIFYLQSESCLPSVATLIKERNNSRRICGELYYIIFNLYDTTIANSEYKILRNFLWYP